uniref:Uncharacterized protein n=1 Tax=Arundo donax TaxID=35708 RepID=A0A0A8ZM64_ARUDO
MLSRALWVELLIMMLGLIPNLHPAVWPLIKFRRNSGRSVMFVKNRGESWNF